jgi:hypothetical protein
VSAGNGAKGLFVMVADGERNSDSMYVRFTRVKYVPPVAAANNAPVLSSIDVASTSMGSTVHVMVNASDDNGVKRVRFATEAGNWGPWVTFTGPHYMAPVSSGTGYKGLFVQVADAQYATSSIKYAKFTRTS